MTKRILCFGDSNSWGYIPGTEGERYPPDVRWPAVMQSKLGQDVLVIEENLNGRTSAFDDPLMDDRNGKRQLPMLLESHRPLDLVIIMLGTNDLKDIFNFSAVDIALGVSSLVQIVAQSNAGPSTDQPPHCLVIAPPRPVATESPIGFKFTTAIERSVPLGKAFADVIQSEGTRLIDASKIVEASLIDGVHLSAESQISLSDYVTKIVRDCIQ